MKKYWQIIISTWQEYMTYRLNFVMWRLRVVMQLFVVYFMWWAILSSRQELFGYTQSMLLTYILLTAAVRTLVMGTTTMEIGAIINQGNLSNFLLKPLNFVNYYVARDVADKALNLAFAIVEIFLVVIILRPPVFLQTDMFVIGLSTAAIAVGIVLYFIFSYILGLLGFWTPDIWAPRFLSFVIIEFFAGGLFPLDILPKPLFMLSQSLPFYYFIYFPIKVYLGQLSPMAVGTGLFVGALWVMALWYGARLIWIKGLRLYTAEGR